MTQVDTLRSMLAAHSGRIVSMADLSAAVGGASRAHIAVLIARLRKRGFPVVSVLGEGYGTGIAAPGNRIAGSAADMLPEADRAAFLSLKRKTGMSNAEALAAMGRADLVGGAA